MANIFIGTSGFTLQNFFPKSLKSSERLSFYVQHFNTVEINTTFYHLPRPTTLETWLKKVPENFIFSFKVFQGITHDEECELNTDALQAWFEAFESFTAPEPRHIMLFQFPSSVVYHDEKFIALLDLLPPNFLYAFEFRHSSWFRETVYEKILRKHGTIVFADTPRKKNGVPVWPRIDQKSAPFSYIRLHGSRELYGSSYSSEELHSYAHLIKEKLGEDKNVFVYFNNDKHGFAAQNAQDLASLLHS